MPDYTAITNHHQQVWSNGDFSKVGTRFAVLPGEHLCETIDLRAGERVLDVAAGNGAAALAAARRFCDVIATDFVPELLTHAAARAEIDELPLTTTVADCQALPFDDENFDVVLSTFGAMFAPDQERTANELLRVCRSGGRIGLSNWTPDGMMGDVFRATGAHVPPPAGTRSPLEWGTEHRLRELFGNRVTSLRLNIQQLVWRFPSAEHMLEYVRTWFGPTKTAFEALDAREQTRLGTDLLSVYAKHNRAGDNTLVAPSDYLEAVAVKA
jgi:ubiquinone/menaquinone biosynthesis C-methylase UbiE